MIITVKEINKDENRNVDNNSSINYNNNINTLNNRIDNNSSNLINVINKMNKDPDILKCIQLFSFGNIQIIICLYSVKHFN